MSIPRKGISVFTGAPLEGNLTMAVFQGRGSPVLDLVYPDPEGPSESTRALLVHAWSSEGNLNSGKNVAMWFGKTHGQG